MNPCNTMITRIVRIFRLIFLSPAGAKSGDFPRIGCGTDLCVSPAGGGRGWILLPFSFHISPCPLPLSPFHFLSPAGGGRGWMC